MVTATIVMIIMMMSIVPVISTTMTITAPFIEFFFAETDSVSDWTQINL